MRLGVYAAVASAALAVASTASAAAVTFSGGKTVQHAGMVTPGCGEMLLVTEGVTEVFFHTTIDDSGNTHTTTHYRQIGIEAVGLDSGTRYRIVGTLDRTTNANALPVTETQTMTSVVTGPGPANNLLMHTTYHVTVNANGELTAEVLEQTFFCPDAPVEPK